MEVSKKYGKYCTGRNDKNFRLNLDNCKLIRIVGRKKYRKVEIYSVFLGIFDTCSNRIYRRKRIAKFLRIFFSFVHYVSDFNANAFIQMTAKE